LRQKPSAPSIVGKKPLQPVEVERVSFEWHGFGDVVVCAGTNEAGVVGSAPEKKF
jgi:hypothetical protein